MKNNSTITLIIISILVFFSSKGKSQEFTLSPSGTSYIYPIVSDPINWNTTNGYGAGQGDHQGDDYYADDWNGNGGTNTDCNAQILAAISGTIIHVENGCSISDPITCGGYYGNNIVIQSDLDPSFVLKYSHFNTVNVVEGQYVNIGDIVGANGNTGNSNYCHVHLVLYKNITSSNITNLQNNNSPSFNLLGSPTTHATPFYPEATYGGTISNSAPSSPVISGASTTTTGTNTTYTVSTGTDPDGDNVKFHLSASTSSLGSSTHISPWYISNGTQSVTLSWANSGTYTIYATTFDVNGNASSTTSKTVVVSSPNSAPSSPLISGASTTTTGTNTTYTISTGTDPDGDNVKFHLSASSSSLGSSTHISPWYITNGTQSVTLSWANSGTYTIYATTFDVNGNASSTTSKTVVVSSPNSAPSSSSISGMSTTTTGTNTTYTVSTGTDPDGDNVKFHLSASNSSLGSSTHISPWYITNGTQSVTLSWENSGTYTIYVTTFDVNGNASSTISKTVMVSSPNSAPSNPLISGASTTTTGTNTTYTVSTGTDPDGDNVKFHLSAASSSLGFSTYISPWYITNGTQQLTLSWANSGTYTIYATTFDVNGNASSTISKTVVVSTPINSAPSFASIIGSNMVTVGEIINYNVSTGTDPDGDNVKFELTALSSSLGTSTHISSWYTTSGTEQISLSWATAGTYAIHATTFDSNGNTSGLTHKTIIVEEELLPSLVVINNNDNGYGSLRDAINWANTNQGSDIITFNIPTSNSGIILLESALPQLTDSSTTIDAKTQPNYQMGIIELDGSNLSSANGLEIIGNDIEVHGLEIHSFIGNGILIDGSNNILIKENKTHDNTIDGIKATNSASNINIEGNISINNSRYGIILRNGSNNSIIGGSGGNGNIASGNGITGIILFSNVSNVEIYGNIIGLAEDGISPMPNLSHGIMVRSGSNNNIVGSTILGLGNIILNNEKDGIAMAFNSIQNKVSGNEVACNGDGIDLGQDGLSNPTSNNNKTAPIIITANQNSIIGTTLPLDNIEVFLVDNNDCPNQNCQGRYYLGSTITDINGDWIFEPSSPIQLGSRVVVTATDSNNNTSEFSSCSDLISSSETSNLVIETDSMQWYLVSSNVIPNTSNLNTLFQGTPVKDLRGIPNGTWDEGVPIFLNTIQNWDYTKPYWIRSLEDYSLSINGGSIPNSDVIILTPNTFNFVPYHGTTNANVEIALSSILPYITEVRSSSGQVFNPLLTGTGLNTLQEFEVGKGYIIYIQNTTDNVILDYQN